MKTERYTIEVEAFENTQLQEMEITKQAYIQQLNALTVEVERTKDNETPLELYYHGNHETETVTIERHAFRSGCTTTYLTKYTCKQGYCFKPKK